MVPTSLTYLMLLIIVPTSTPTLQIIQIEAEGISVEFMDIPCTARSASITGYIISLNETNFTISSAQIYVQPHSFNISGLLPNTDYSIRISTITSDGNLSLPSPPLTFRTESGKYLRN